MDTPNSLDILKRIKELFRDEEFVDRVTAERLDLSAPI
jgi:hypothetical protein